jgi:hypothetical protein
LIAAYNKCFGENGEGEGLIPYFKPFKDQADKHAKVTRRIKKYNKLKEKEQK